MVHLLVLLTYSLYTVQSHMFMAKMWIQNRGFPHPIRTCSPWHSHPIRNPVNLIYSYPIPPVYCGYPQMIHGYAGL